MKTRRHIAALVLAILTALTIYGLWRTGRPELGEAESNAAGASGSAQEPVIDQAALNTARRLIQMPTSEEEAPLAQQALRIADREMDLAFAAAIADVTQNPPTLSPEAKAIDARIQAAEKQIEADKNLADALEKKSGGGAKKRCKQKHPPATPPGE